MQKLSFIDFNIPCNEFCIPLNIICKLPQTVFEESSNFKLSCLMKTKLE